MEQILTILALLLTLTTTFPQQADPALVPEAFFDIGKTLTALQEEHPDGRIFTRPDGYPDAAAICFGEPEGDLAYVFFGTQGDDYLPVMAARGEELRCSGLLTTAGTLFPSIPDAMSFSDFFSLLDVTEYDAINAEEAGIAAGWMIFEYDGKQAWMDPGEADLAVRRDAHMIITDLEVEDGNVRLAGESGLLPQY